MNINKILRVEHCNAKYNLKCIWKEALYTFICESGEFMGLEQAIQTEITLQLKCSAILPSGKQGRVLLEKGQESRVLPSAAEMQLRSEIGRLL